MAMPATVAMPPNGAARVVVTGATGALTVSTLQHVVTVDIDPATQAVRIFASDATGTDTIHIVDASGTTIDVPVRVAPYGGTLVESIDIEVTGSPADGTFVVDRVRDAVRRATVAQPGAVVAIGDPQAVPDVLASGTRASIVVPVTIAGGANYLDVVGSTTVNVQNVALGAFSPAILHYDDDPEQIHTDGLLYRTTVTAQTPVRIYYYHQSDVGAHRFLMLLSSESTEPTPVHVVAATAGPNVDVMTVGHNVSRNFVLSKAHNQGSIISLPADSGYTLFDTPFGAGAGIAGTVDLRVLGGGPVDVMLISVPADADDATIAQETLTSQLPGDGHHRSGAFKIDAYGVNFRSYDAGGPDAQVVYGDAGPPPLDATSGRDAGDYGIVQSISFALNNPTDKPALAYLYERPIGGPVRSSFLINGVQVELGCVRDSSTRYQIGSYTIAPKATVNVDVETMTDGGSNYPVEIGVTATAPELVTPAIDAADGCFPKPQGGATAEPSPEASPEAPLTPEPSPSASSL